MIISNEKALELIKSPQNRTFINEAIEHEQLLKAFAFGENKDILIKMATDLVANERKDIIVENFGVHTKPILDKVSTHFERIFEANNRMIESNFSDLNQKIDFEDYVSKCYLAEKGVKNGINNEDFFRKYGIENILFAPNTICYLDFDSDNENLAKRANPIVNTAGIENLRDIEVSANRIEYLIIQTEIKRDKDKVTQYFLIDDVRYALFEKVRGKEVVFVKEANHYLEVCPACFFTDKTKNKKNKIVRKSPITDSLPDLEFWLILKNFSKLYQLESGVPIKYVPEEPCNRTYQDKSSGEIVKCFEGQFIVGGKIVKSCTCKSHSKKVVWGKQIDIPKGLVISKNNEINRLATDFKNIYGYEDFSITPLQFNESNLNDKRNQIEFDIIGKGYNTTNKTREARNELDVRSDSEDMKRVLASISEQIENTWLWIENLIIKARKYNTFVSRVVNLGRDYILQSNETLLKEYQMLIKNGADAILLNRKQKEIAQNQYKYDKIYLDFFEILGAISPFRHISLDVLLANQDKFLAKKTTEIHYYMRLYEAQLINEFFYLNNSQLWGIEMNSQNRLKKIKSWLIKKAIEIANDDITKIGLKPKDIEKIEKIKPNE